MRNQRSTGRVRQDRAEDIVEWADYLLMELQLYQTRLPAPAMGTCEVLRELIRNFNIRHPALRRTGGLAPLRCARNQEGLRPFGPTAKEALEGRRVGRGRAEKREPCTKAEVDRD